MSGEARCGRQPAPKCSAQRATVTTVVLTGASSGLGARAAHRLHDKGIEVVVVGRDAERTAAVANELGAQRYTVDFGQLDQVRVLAKTLTREYPHIDVLAANAGGVPQQERTVGDVEATFQVNALGPWLLIELVAGALSGGRVLATSSRSHSGAHITEDAIETVVTSTGRLSRHRVYARAKLAAGILLREYGRRHPDIDVGDFHPGIMATDFGRYLGPTGTVLKVLAAPLLDSADDGARRLVHLALTPEPLAGRYFVKSRPATGSPQLHDRRLGDRLWRLAQSLTDTPS
jgi:NAD(P)-dependent dehydrogenase (short-subunit alcohol dehydrogenase family)